MSEGDAYYRVKKLEEDGNYLLEFVIRLLKEKKEKEAQQLALEVKKIHLLIGGNLIAHHSFIIDSINFVLVFCSGKWTTPRCSKSGPSRVDCDVILGLFAVVEVVRSL